MHYKKTERALKESVREVVEHPKKTGRPLAIWKNGKVVKISADKILRNPEKY